MIRIIIITRLQRRSEKRTPSARMAKVRADLQVLRSFASGLCCERVDSVLPQGLASSWRRGRRAAAIFGRFRAKEDSAY